MSPLEFPSLDPGASSGSLLVTEVRVTMAELLQESPGVTIATMSTIW